MALNPNVVIVNPGDLITSVHLNNVRANLDRLDTSKLSLTGGAVTGSVSFSGPAFNIARTGTTRPAVSFFSSDTFTTRQAALIGADTGLEIIADVGPIRFANTGTEFARIDASNMLLGKTATSFASTGIELGYTVGRIASTMAVANMNVLLNHTAAADASAALFAQFQRTGTAIGSITQVSTTGVAFNTTSDERLKDVLGPVADPLDVIAALNPVRFAWKSTGEQQDGFLAHEVQAVVPWAVSGERGAVHPAPPLIDVVADDGTVTQAPDPSYPPEGSIAPQQLDVSKLVPVLVAAVQALTARVAELEAAA